MTRDIQSGGQGRRHADKFPEKSRKLLLETEEEDKIKVKGVRATKKKATDGKV